jgi:hypothetical protein
VGTLKNIVVDLHIVLLNLFFSIQYEAEKLSLSMKTIKLQLTTQNEWFESSEINLLNLLSDLSQDRYLRELAAGEELVMVIEQCIMHAQPLQELWLISADASPLVDPMSAWERMKSLIAPEVLRAMEAQYLDSTKRPDGEQQIPTTSDELNTTDNSRLSSRPQSLSIAESNKRPSTANSMSRRGSSTLSSLVSQDKIGRNPMRGKRDDCTQLRSALLMTSPLMRTPPKSAPSASSRRKSNADPSQSNKEKLLYLQQRKDLETKFEKLRAEKEAHYRNLGMSSSAALLAAHHEILFEEEHQLQDLEAKFRPRLASAKKSRENSGKR